MDVQHLGTAFGHGVLALDWDASGLAVLAGVLDDRRVRKLSGWVEDLEAMPEGPEGPMHHFEQTAGGAVIARTERFADVHEGLGSLLRGDVAELVGAIVGEPVALFKEKVNYKYPGGAGFAAHQDARAYRFADWHVSVMVPLDPATVDSGCLWFAPNPSRDLLEVDDRGRIVDQVADRLDWYPVPVGPGDLVVFDSAVPHRSGTNTSDHPRRAMYLTYTALADGDFRQRYYADKGAEFAATDGTFGGERVRLSISDDFLGRPVTAAPAPDPVGEVVDLVGSGAAAVLYDESVTELEHALQAAMFAEGEGAPPELVAAALLHDVGHLLVGDLRPLDEELDVDAHHEGVGAAWLRPRFGAAVSDPVALHVAAKRYLCAADPSYFDSLSGSSVRSLRLQGGPMDDREALAFESNRYFDDAVRLRRWDDRAKVPGAATPPLDHFVALLAGVVDAADVPVSGTDASADY